MRGGGDLYTEDFRHNGFFFRKLVLKLLLIITIILVIVWILPKFISYKPSNKSQTIKITEENTNDTSISENLTKLKEAALLYYSEDKLPKSKDDIVLVTLNDLQKENLISALVDSDNKACDGKKSYAKITKLDDEYLLKVYIKCGNKTDYLLVHVGKYDYCTNTICEKNSSNDNIIEEDKDNDELGADKPRVVMDDKETDPKPQVTANNSGVTNSQQTGNSSSNMKLSGFSAWSDYIRTSCDVKEVTCSLNDYSCLAEVRIKRQVETVGTYNKDYYATSLVLDKRLTINTKSCSNYNYIIIQGSIYRTVGNYEEILTLSNRKSTANWTYKETISTTTTPNFGANKYYKFVGADFKNCQATCTTQPAYYYDVYEYNKPITKVSSTTGGCSNVVNKNINIYQVIKKQEIARREEPLYATACYQSTRNRKKIIVKGE